MPNNWPILRVGIANIQLVAAGLAVWFLTLLPTLWNAMVVAVYILLVVTLIVSLVDYWRTFSRLELTGNELRIEYSVRRVAIAYPEILYVNLTTTSFVTRLQGTIRLRSRRMPVSFVCAGFSTNWGSIRDTETELRRRLTADGIDVR